MHSRLNIPAPAGVKAATDATVNMRYVIERPSLGLWPKRASGQVAEKRTIVCLARPYRKPTQVGECKCTQARERNLSKELGTLAP